MASKTRKQAPKPAPKLTGAQARAFACAWWSFTSAMILEISRTAAALGKEACKPNAPLEGSIHAEKLFEFVASLEDARLVLLDCHPQPAIAVVLPDPVHGGVITGPRRGL